VEEGILLIIFFIAAIGTLFLFISALGIVRLPDVFTRMHAAGKAATLGVSCLLLSTGIFFWEDDQFWRMIALILIFFVTAPIATTSMARAAYRTSEPETIKLDYDELKER
jgi:multicomponent Na+:H+ antiporter subunit G